MLTIRDGNGELLAIVQVDADFATGEMTIRRVTQGKGRLLQHYFGQGQRLVLLDSGSEHLPATLSTRWLGAERQWRVRLSHAVHVATAGPPTTNELAVSSR